MSSKLLVDNIEGRTGQGFLTPDRPAFRARIAESSSGHGDTGTLVFETEDFDIGGNYDTSTGKFTAPITGIYHIMFRCLSATNNTGGANTSGEYPYGDFYKNGSICSGTRFYAYDQGSTFHATLNGNTTLQLSVGAVSYTHLTLPTILLV